MNTAFRDRRDAGRRLAELLACHANDPGVLVLGLPRGGVPVAWEVARELNAPLDIFLVRKLGMPQQPELAMGAIATGGVIVLNPEVIEAVRVPVEAVRQVAREEIEELRRRERLYRGDRPEPDVAGRTVILVDDGLATGATMRAAARGIQQLRPRRIIIAVPVAAPEIRDSLRDDADDVVCVATPDPFLAVGAWYERFDQTSDDEVRAILAQAQGRGAVGKSANEEATAVQSGSPVAKSLDALGRRDGATDGADAGGTNPG